MKSLTSSLRIGVTGGIGSGKSTVCKLFASLGRTVLSADEIARELTISNNEIKSSIRGTFGDRFFQTDGSLDRKALAQVVFKDASSRKKLNAIIHPHVFASIESTINHLSSAQRFPYLIIEAALIYETGMDKELDYVVVVSADLESCIRRVMSRDSATRSDIVARIQSQMDMEKKARMADFVIQNDGEKEDLAEKVNFLDRIFQQISAKERPK